MKFTSGQLLLKEDYKGRDLLIVNIQPSMESRISFNLIDFGKWLQNNGDDFYDIFFLYNGQVGESKHNTDVQISTWYNDRLGIIDGFTSIAQDIKELPSYFDKILDTDYSNDDIIRLGKYMTSRNYDKIDDMSKEEIINLNINEGFKEELVNGKHVMNIPYDFLKLIKSLKNPVVIGGLGHESMRMLDIIFAIVNKNMDKNKDWCF